MASHDHAHEHHHHGDAEDNYYLDQLCMVAMSGAFGGICLALYLWKTDMLSRMLAPQFHLFVLISGVTLVVVAFLRAVSLWVQVGREHAHSHDHGHSHSHGHSHEHGEPHEHGPHCQHDHGHHQHHEHHDHEHHEHHGHHHHDHDEADHDHAWSPWRYVVLLIPVIFFMLGFPNKPPSVTSKEPLFAKEAAKETIEEAMGLLNPGPVAWPQLAFIGYLSRDQVSKNVEDWDFKNLTAAVSAAARSPDPNVRNQWKDKSVRVIGQYAPSNQSDREFRLVRLKISCCAADLVQLDLPIMAKESIRNYKPNDWVRVTGRVEFRKRRDEVVPIINVPGARAVEPTAPDPNPYIQ